MARPREFDPDTVMDRAMGVFWEHGYVGASLPDLLDGMGLTRGSFYKAFKGKKQLFLAALDRYYDEEVVPGITLLKDAEQGSGATRIKQVFGAIPAAVERGDERGCLLCSAASGRAMRDDDIARVIHRQLGAFEGGFESALADSDTAQGTARLLVSQYMGMRAMARGGVSAETLQESVAALDALLSPHKAPDQRERA
ncbi:MAG: TetR/AcrR family transcriptional regulator [Pseudomonadota bacterium]